MKRSESLDALRGIAILLMVLSGSIAFGGILPAWMYHAQVPPPAHVFKPDLPGITWVDLVFPFFLFSMGAAIPLSMKKRTDGNESSWMILFHLIQRYVMLLLFALFTLHARAWVIAKDPGVSDYLLSVAGFFLLFIIYTNWKVFLNVRWAIMIRVAGILIVLIFFFSYDFFSNERFSLYKSDVIILVLANMAFFGSVVWWLTRNRPLLRIAVLPFIMGVFLASGIDGSINNILFNFTPLPWAYKFYYLKYLFIILPGTLAGEWLIQVKKIPVNVTNKRQDLFLVPLIWSLLIITLTCLYNRWLILNLALSSLLCVLILYLPRKGNAEAAELRKFGEAGVYLLLLGLLFEAYEGGIKKDISTYSYYFVSAGLAFLILLSLIILEESGYGSRLLGYLAANGKNPMIAYTAGNLLLIPLMRITGTGLWLDSLSGTAAGGFLMGVIFTGIVSLITVYCTKKKVFWKT